MRIWVFTAEFAPFISGGLGVVATNLSHNLAAMDVPQIVISQGRGGPTFTDDVWRFPKSAPYYDRDLRRFASSTILRYLDALPSPDVLHVHSVSFAEVALASRGRHRSPLVYTCHSLVCDEPGSVMRDKVAADQDELLASADAVVVPSEWARLHLTATYPNCAHKVHVIPNGVFSPNVPYSTNPLPPRGRLLFVGRLVPGKGLEELIRGLASLRGRYPVSLDVVGKGSAAYVDALRALAAEEGMAETISWLGYRSPETVAGLYAQYAAVIVPSHQESFGLVALEALAGSAPLIATRAGGLGEFISEQVAQVVLPGDPSGIADAVAHMLEHPQEAWQRVERGREVAAHYGWERIARRYLTLFESLAAGLDAP